jgi:hypothetical protein
LQASGHRFDPDRLHQAADDETQQARLAAHVVKAGQRCEARHKAQLCCDWRRSGQRDVAPKIFQMMKTSVCRTLRGVGDTESVWRSPIWHCEWVLKIDAVNTAFGLDERFGGFASGSSGWAVRW